jgi:hypothetical protein
MTDVMPEQLVDLDELTGGETTPANTRRVWTLSTNS